MTKIHRDKPSRHTKQTGLPLAVVKDNKPCEGDEGWEYGFDSDANTISTAYDGDIIRPSKTMAKQ